jgi:hypothetical protein
MNSTLVTKYLFQSTSGGGTNLDTEKNKTENRGQEEKNKSDMFRWDWWRQDDDWIQSTEWKIWSYERCDNEKLWA